MNSSKQTQPQLNQALNPNPAIQLINNGNGIAKVISSKDSDWDFIIDQIADLNNLPRRFNRIRSQRHSQES